uniref:RNA helicase n=1 Tax=Palpitomonas bilix TaxID=652834 RepID=A0A7S3DB06_9EUKA|mmetsp:Transcript_29443/g.75973  ORF Transcript_29443/g.75973 Transcript_29443/m.75973 type:complete len:659 (+) Transcript_29443:127-2103(+)|eukprot:CAMPEP_0113887362 /NCGR_PEP_ID=MMETSP0780_2-20120614/12172_1 /TAXON_ID=652834 /ORGANISM="Palpitomonas bilix" /LENGTH=658 /DNA_ID=CAMNT_0000875887 /DNA_START=32 /DNA_END=2008 /DNA_ORIENTATION=+ /assembly_acc=CAM_ASM_000599
MPVRELSEEAKRKLDELRRKRRRIQEEEERENSLFHLLGEDDPTAEEEERERQEKEKQRDVAEYETLKMRKEKEERRRQELLEERRKRKKADAGEEEKEDTKEEEESGVAPIEKRREAAKSLLESQMELKKEAEKFVKSAADQAAEEERQILRELEEKRALKAVQELAKGVEYTEPIKTSWRPTEFLENLPEEELDRIREEFYIHVEGDNCPPPVTRFKDLKIPFSLLDYLKAKGISKPTPIQMQALPVVLSGRDLIGIAFTGSGKTLVFSLPILLFSAEEELNNPFQRGDGPLGLILCPSRELANQTYEGLLEMADAMVRAGLPAVRVLLAIGGIDMREQADVLNRGPHVVVATPGRLQDMLEKKRLVLKDCRYLALDEADRMIDQGFEDDMRNIMSFFSCQRQTVMFSATMPQKIQSFAKTALIQPITVNVGRAGAASLDVTQEVEYVKQEAKIVYLLQCLSKTPPPVLIFCQNKKDVDDIHEYLVLKKVAVASIHGGKTQEERKAAVKDYKHGKKDVLVATDVASKGLDFADVQHVINFDMPDEIENYIHRIGRTGRCGNRGVATTFINKSNSEVTLRDLKHLLIEAKQRLPPALAGMDDPLDDAVAEKTGVKGCAYCGGPGHRVTQCPKLEATRAKMGNGPARELLSTGGGGEY